MAIEEEEPAATTPPERKGRTDEDAAIAAKREREETEVEREGNAIGEATTELGNAVDIEDAMERIPQRRVAGDRNAAGVADSWQSLEQACRTKGFR